KAEVLAQFAEALNTPVVTEGPERARVAAELEAERKELSGYVNALHKRYPNGLSAYDCFSQLILRNEEEPPRELIDADTLHQTPEEMSAAR
ncbi:hypothetical protein GUG52_27030, partial [Xanthomonas citri pv. citri]|nr:hypothetical protein [Xanthomonas citri pv. citri]